MIDPAPHYGQRRVVTTTTNITLTGEIAPGPDGSEGLVGVDLGVTLYIAADDIASITTQEDRSRPDGSHVLAAGQDAVSDQAWHTAKCVHEAAHAVVARVLGITVTHAFVDGDRTAYVGGRVSTTGGDAQHVAVYLAAGPIAHARHLVRGGAAHPLTEAAVEMIAGQGDHARILHHVEAGYAVWRRQADVDAAALLDEPAVWEAALTLGRALDKAGADGLTGEQIDEVIGAAAELTAYRVWTPDLSDVGVTTA